MERSFQTTFSMDIGPPQMCSQSLNFWNTKADFRQCLADLSISEARTGPELPPTATGGYCATHIGKTVQLVFTGVRHLPVEQYLPK
jgi:hypothetical protein